MTDAEHKWLFERKAIIKGTNLVRRVDFYNLQILTSSSDNDIHMQALDNPSLSNSNNLILIWIPPPALFAYLTHD